MSKEGSPLPHLKDSPLYLCPYPVHRLTVEKREEKFGSWVRRDEEVQNSPYRRHRHDRHWVTHPETLVTETLILWVTTAYRFDPKGFQIISTVKSEVTH